LSSFQNREDWLPKKEGSDSNGTSAFFAKRKRKTIPREGEAGLKGGYKRKLIYRASLLFLAPSWEKIYGDNKEKGTLVPQSIIKGRTNACSKNDMLLGPIYATRGP